MKYVLMLLGVLILAIAWTSPVVAAEYTGAKSCGRCHRKDNDGKQYPIWEGTQHAKAYANLGSAKAKEMAKKVGVSGDPQKDVACLVCHATGATASKDMMGRRFSIEDGVQCESCHGAGSDYDSNRTMKQIRKELGPDAKGKCPTCEKTGFQVASENTCKTCHAPSITVGGKTYKNPAWPGSFNFNEKWEKIKHPIP